MDMSSRHIFHLSIPVSDLELAKRFYVDVLAATVGRENEAWLDILLWGHQITLQLRPDEVLSSQAQGKRHFGVTLPWHKWEREAARVGQSGTIFLAEPQIFGAGSPEEHAKFFLVDPSHNVIEIKTYRDVQGALGLSGA